IKQEEKQEEEEPLSKSEGSIELTEEELFKKEMEGVKRLHYPNKIPRKREPKPPDMYSEDEEIMHRLIDRDIKFWINDTVEYIEGYNIKDYDPNVLKKLKRGEIAYQDFLDLHGKTKDEAKILVKNFIERSRRTGLGCVLIVHGRGMHSRDYIPVLKEALVGWLSSKATGRHILAFCSAKPKDGGTGAIYVLLRK
ncbi:MAG: Smr/MutS family protein, partial [Myxococcota bacterium]